MATPRAVGREKNARDDHRAAARSAKVVHHARVNRSVTAPTCVRDAHHALNTVVNVPHVKAAHHVETMLLNAASAPSAVTKPTAANARYMPVGANAHRRRTRAWCGHRGPTRA